jgi:hypothetical protein
MKNIITTLFSALLIGCSPKPETPPEQPILKVSVFQSGKVTIAGENVSIQDLKNHLTELKSKDGIVWYYRESGQEEPPPIAMEVISTIADFKMPTSLSSKPDFSDYIDENGYSIPRE